MRREMHEAGGELDRTCLGHTASVRATYYTAAWGAPPALAWPSLRLAHPCTCAGCAAPNGPNNAPCDPSEPPLPG